jgi:membrane-associated phospholipid phosphatase
MLCVFASVSSTIAQTATVSRSRCDAVSSTQLFGGTLVNFRELANRDSVGILGIGAAAAFAAHSVDRDVTRDFAGQTSFGDTFKAGEVVGGTPFELGASFAAYAIGRALGKPCVASLGADLFQAQVMGETLAFAVKQATRRSRPQGTGYSFPSGHATAAFASATVLQRHFGWKVGAPAYAVATYVAASRVQGKYHYLSDVAFGAALGIVAGRAIPIGGGNHLMMTPITTPDGTGAGAGFSWMGRR